MEPRDDYESLVVPTREVGLRWSRPSSTSTEDRVGGRGERVGSETTSVLLGWR